MRRLATLVLLAFLGAACSVPGGKVTSPTPETVVGTVPTTPTVTTPTETLPPEYANGDPAAGKSVFAQNGCSACHTLQDAGATGTIGRNLDEAKPSLALAANRIANGKAGMPPFKGQLTAKQIADVAAYVVQASHA